MIFKAKRMDIELTEEEMGWVYETAELLDRIADKMESNGYDTIEGDSDFPIDDIRIFTSLLYNLEAGQAVVYQR